MTASGSTRTKADDERDPEAAPSWRERPETPKPKPRTAGEIAFLDLGPGAHKWLVEAAAVGAQRIRSKMAAAVELAAMVGVEQVDAGPDARRDRRPLR